MICLNIIATEFGGGSDSGMDSAYGGLIDPSALQVSLPARVPPGGRQVIVTARDTGLSVECLVNDVGPWNTHDQYWLSGGRPAAEAQYRGGKRAQNGRIPSNTAGIDMTPAVFDALGIHGPANTRQTVVSWQFA